MQLIKSSLLVLLCICVAALSSCTQDDTDIITIDPDTTTDESTGTDNTSSTFTINLDPSSCQVDVGISSEFTMTIDESRDTRSFSGNSIPIHKVGAFPNPGNPNTISAVNFAGSLDLTPQLAGGSTSAQGYVVGILNSGIAIEPFTAEFFVGSTGTMNRAWNITTLTTSVNLGLDCNNAHVQPPGFYHYHGTPSAYIEELSATGAEMVKVGYAADGFPMYYKYGYDENGATISPMESGYQLKTGNRGGDGISAPGGNYDGTYFQDYEFIDGLSALDECNGRWGKTPESDNGILLYNYG